MNNIPIILLAAGQSKRMRGSDKLLQDVSGVTLLRQQTERACAATDARVYVTVPSKTHPRAQEISECDVTIVPVPDADLGLSASLRCGIAALPPDTVATMVLLADLPDLTRADLETIFAAVDLSSDIRIWRGATAEGAAGHPIVFASTLFDDLKDLHGDTGGAPVIARNKNVTKLVALAGDRARRDLDTPEDWAVWRTERAVKR